MPGQNEVFETLPQAAERIKRQRLQELEKQFPSPWLRPGWRRTVLAFLEVGAVCGVIVLAFAFLKKVAGIGVDPDVLTILLAIFLTLYQLMGSDGSRLERRWLTRNPTHRYATAEARDAAIAEASNPRSLRIAAVEEFAERLTRHIAELSEGRYGPRSPPCSAPEERAIHRALELNEYLKDPSCYRGMHFLYSGPGVRITMDEDSSSAGADLPQDPDHDHENRWFDEIVRDYKSAPSS